MAQSYTITYKKASGETGTYGPISAGSVVEAQDIAKARNLPSMNQWTEYWADVVGGATPTPAPVIPTGGNYIQGSATAYGEVQHLWEGMYYTADQYVAVRYGGAKPYPVAPAAPATTTGAGPTLENIRTDVMAEVAGYPGQPAGYREQLIDRLVQKYGEDARKMVIDTIYKELRGPGEEEYYAPPGTTYADVIGDDKEFIGTSDIATAEDEGTEEKIDIAKGIEDDQTEISRLTVKQELQNLREEMGLDPDTGLPAKPGLPTYADDFEALRSDQGVAATETQINNIESEIRDLEASLRLGIYDEEGKLKPMELIGTKQRELIRQAQEEIDSRNRRKATLVDELNIKNTLISNIMGFKQLDYNAAVNNYNSSFTQAIQLINLVEGRVDKVDQEANRQRDDARANLTLYHNLLKDVGWDQVGPNLRTAIEALEMKIDPSMIGITEAFTKANPGVKVDYTTTGYDAAGNQIVSFFSYNDGNPKLIRTITTAGVKAGGVRGTTITTSTGETIDFATVGGLRRAKELGYGYSDIYSWLVSNQGADIEATAAQNLLREAGFVLPAEQIKKDSDLAILSQDIKTYMDKWKSVFGGGDKGAGTREEFIANRATELKNLTHSEIADEVYRQITDEWLKENKQAVYLFQ